MGYHLRKIKTIGIYGEISKIKEELEELEEALEQDNKILAMCEIADLYGAVEEFAARYYNLGMSDIAKMSDSTKRAFRDGSRK